jgi:hypothetical protein
MPQSSFSDQPTSIPAPSFGGFFGAIYQEPAQNSFGFAPPSAYSNAPLVPPTTSFPQPAFGFAEPTALGIGLQPASHSAPVWGQPAVFSTLSSAGPSWSPPSFLEPGTLLPGSQSNPSQTGSWDPPSHVAPSVGSTAAFSDDPTASRPATVQSAMPVQRSGLQPTQNRPQLYGSVVAPAAPPLATAPAPSILRGIVPPAAAWASLAPVAPPQPQQAQTHHAMQHAVPEPDDPVQIEHGGAQNAWASRVQSAQPPAPIAGHPPTAAWSAGRAVQSQTQPQPQQRQQQQQQQQQRAAAAARAAISAARPTPPQVVAARAPAPASLVQQQQQQRGAGGQPRGTPLLTQQRPGATSSTSSTAAAAQRPSVGRTAPPARSLAPAPAPAPARTAQTAPPAPAPAASRTAAAAAAAAPSRAATPAAPARAAAPSTVAPAAAGSTGGTPLSDVESAMERALRESMRDPDAEFQEQMARVSGAAECPTAVPCVLTRRPPSTVPCSSSSRPWQRARCRRRRTRSVTGRTRAASSSTRRSIR